MNRLPDRLSPATSTRRPTHSRRCPSRRLSKPCRANCRRPSSLSLPTDSDTLRQREARPLNRRASRRIPELAEHPRRNTDPSILPHRIRFSRRILCSATTRERPRLISSAAINGSRVRLRESKVHKRLCQRGQDSCPHTTATVRSSSTSVRSRDKTPRSIRFGNSSMLSGNCPARRTLPRSDGDDSFEHQNRARQEAGNTDRFLTVAAP